MHREQQSFEEVLQALEEKVSLLESGNLSLEEALRTFEEGVKLSNLCHFKLKQVEDKLKVLQRGDNGEYLVLDLEVEGDKK